MDSKEFFESWKKILGFTDGMFYSRSRCSPEIWIVKFRFENDLEWPWVLTFSKPEWEKPECELDFKKLKWAFKNAGCRCFNDLLETFVKDLEENIKKSDFIFYVENEKTKERRMICENPRSLEEMLILSELNFRKWEKAEDGEG